MDNAELLELAKKVCENAYAKYSNFHVGACALYDTGNYYLGCNVENASYGLTLCAERNAMSNAVAAGEKGKLVKIAIFVLIILLMFQKLPYFQKTEQTVCPAVLAVNGWQNLQKTTRFK